MNNSNQDNQFNEYPYNCEGWVYKGRDFEITPVPVQRRIAPVDQRRPSSLHEQSVHPSKRLYFDSYLGVFERCTAKSGNIYKQLPTLTIAKKS